MFVSFHPRHAEKQTGRPDCPNDRPERRLYADLCSSLIRTEKTKRVKPFRHKKALAVARAPKSEKLFADKGKNLLFEYMECKKINLTFSAFFIFSRHAPAQAYQASSAP